MLVDVWGHTLVDADHISSVAQVAGMFLMPGVGLVYDAKQATAGGQGHNRRPVGGAVLGCLIFAASWLTLTHGSAGGTLKAVAPIGGTVGIAAAAALFFGGTWPMVPVLVVPEQVGLAFGLMTALQNCALSVVLVSAGSLRDITSSFAPVGVLLACLGVTSAALGTAVMRSLGTHGPGGRGVISQSRE